jgi:undecaprenyl-diphosphatase
MSSWISAILLGIVQGLTEFLPVSSSGHIEIVNFILGNDKVGSENLLMTVTLHFATALATVYVFRKDIYEIILGLFNKNENHSREFALKIILSMIPAALVGVLLESQIESLFGGSILLVLIMLIVTAILLILADKAKTTDKGVSYNNSIVIGIAQAIAILPGISRSGATISASVLLGIDREKAARFSFLMVIPLIFGKMAKDILAGDLSSSTSNLFDLGLGFIFAFFTGIFACKVMIQLVKSSQLKYFAFYCLAISFIGLIYYSFYG